jgi:hypothetical protein
MPSPDAPPAPRSAASRSRISISVATSADGASGSSPRLSRAISRFIGRTTKTNTTAAMIRNEISALRNSP